MGLYNGEKPVAQLLGCHDLHTTDGESVIKRKAIACVVYSTQAGIRLNRGHSIKGATHVETRLYSNCEYHKGT